MKEQHHRIVRVIYLVLEIPYPPGCVKFQVAQHYSYDELIRFEKGEQDLYVKSSITRGRGARGGSTNWSLRQMISDTPYQPKKQSMALKSLRWSEHANYTTGKSAFDVSKKMMEKMIE